MANYFVVEKKIQNVFGLTRMLGVLNPGCFFSSPSSLQKEESVFLSVVLMMKHSLSPEREKTDDFMVNAKVSKTTEGVDVCHLCRRQFFGSGAKASLLREQV